MLPLKGNPVPSGPLFDNVVVSCIGVSSENFQIWWFPSVTRSLTGRVVCEKDGD